MSTEVLLINPNRMQPPIAPLALEYLATALEAAGITCAVSDLCLAEDPTATLAADLRAHAPRLVAVTMRNSDDCYCATRHSFIPDYARLLEGIRKDTDAPVVLGGAGYSTAPEAILRLTGADYGIVGDGEEALPALFRALDSSAGVSGIAGLVWREGEDVLRNAPVQGPFGQQPLSRTHLDSRRYFALGGQGGLEAKRGCDRACVYCADCLSKGRNPRLRPPAAVTQEARNLLAQGVDAVHLCDSEFNLPLDHAKDVCRAFIAAGLGESLRWWAYLAPVPFDAELATLLVRAGCAGVNFGADSGDAEMLRRLGRQHTPEDLRETGRLCRSVGLTYMYDLLLAGPGESRESMRRTIELMQGIGPDCVGVAYGLRLYAGTAAAALARHESFTPDNPNLQGQIVENEQMAWPVFYVESALGSDSIAYLRALIGGDQRFFFGWPDEGQPDYNYDDNQPLVEAISNGARGAYWDILRQLPPGDTVASS